MMDVEVGSLVQTRGREWVVLPSVEDDVLMLRPLGGTDEEVTGVCLSLESVEPASFSLPGPDALGDQRAGRLLRDAVRLGFRSSVGPFRSFARIAVEPRPYQLVPLLMALRLDPVRLLIADDVGIGKTIEASLIARELLDRGEVKRMAVLCPPQLAEQWQKELARKFNIHAALVLSSTASQLERNCKTGQSLFDVYPHVVVSTDFIKADKRRDDFRRSCPELVIVDEAHTCALSSESSSRKHQRYKLLQALASTDRHILLVTATPHSGKDESFRSLIGLLHGDLAALPEDMSGDENRKHRQTLARYFVQRRRPDIRMYMNANTRFPEAQERNVAYMLSAPYKDLLADVLRFAQDMVAPAEGQGFAQRVRWWSALGLLRALASSPAAALETLKSRSKVADSKDLAQANAVGQRLILDQDIDDASDPSDFIPGSDLDDAEGNAQYRKTLRALQKKAQQLTVKDDNKAKQVVRLVKELCGDGDSPIIFCRFIHTVEYLGEFLRTKCKKYAVEIITSKLPAAEREARIAALPQDRARILVCTDCLSEGVNLQDKFNAVIHYDLPWNPTRLEQREGRVNRFGQPEPVVKLIYYYGEDNLIDEMVRQVLLEKHKAIRNRLGLTIPVPIQPNEVVNTLFDRLLSKDAHVTADDNTTMRLAFDEFQQEALDTEWERRAEQEKKRQSLFMQGSIKVDEVNRVLEDSQEAIGSGVEIAAFFLYALREHGAIVERDEDDVLTVDLTAAPRALKDFMGQQERFRASFQLPVPHDVLYLHRTHPLVQGLANYVMDTALDPLAPGLARRASVATTDQVTQPTTLLLVRFRFHVKTSPKGKTPDPSISQEAILAEDCKVLGFTGTPAAPDWFLNQKRAEELLVAASQSNATSASDAHPMIQAVNDNIAHIHRYLERYAERCGGHLADAHLQVRDSANMRKAKIAVEPVLPPDILGTYIYLPAADALAPSPDLVAQAQPPDAAEPPVSTAASAATPTDEGKGA